MWWGFESYIAVFNLNAPLVSKIKEWKSDFTQLFAFS